MNEKTIYAILMWAAAALAVIAGGATIVILILVITEGLKLLIPTVLLAVVTIGCGVAAVAFGQLVEERGKKVFSNDAEREVLSRKQQRELRKARGSVVMQRAMVEIEHERDNIVHRQLEAASDPDKPPHRTRFGE